MGHRLAQGNEEEQISVAGIDCGVSKLSQEARQHAQGIERETGDCRSSMTDYQHNEFLGCRRNVLESDQEPVIKAVDRFVRRPDKLQSNGSIRTARLQRGS